MKKRKSGVEEGKGVPARRDPSRLIDVRINELSDWRGETLDRVRMLIKQADPDVVEEVKWRGPTNYACAAGGLLSPPRSAEARVRHLFRCLTATHRRRSPATHRLCLTHHIQS